MTKRYARSGNTDEALTTPAVDVRELMSAGGFQADRKFWLRFVWVNNSHATDDATVQIYDQDEGVAVAANERLSFLAPALTLTVIEVPAPGERFITNITAAVTNGTVAIYQAGAGGYEEG